MLMREAFRFGLVGGAQIVLEWVLFVAVTSLGVLAGPANVIARLCVAGLGYAANAHYTFAARRQEPLGRRAFGRYALVWISATGLSSLAMGWAEHQWGLSTAFLLKPFVDVCLAGASFLASRHWVYR